MEGKYEKKGLLEYLAESMDCIYLSDLVVKRTSSGNKLTAVIKAIPPEAYELKEWMDAFCYFSQDGADFQSVEEAKKALIKAVN